MDKLSILWKTFFNFVKRKFMSLESIIAQDQQEIVAAQAAVESATQALQVAQAKLAADQSALANSQPVVVLITQIEQSAESLDETTKAALLALTAQAKALF